MNAASLNSAVGAALEDGASLRGWTEHELSPGHLQNEELAAFAAARKLQGERNPETQEDCCLLGKNVLGKAENTALG